MITRNLNVTFPDQLTNLQVSFPLVPPYFFLFYSDMLLNLYLIASGEEIIKDANKCICNKNVKID